MTDITIRKNEKCIIGLPSCDFVFSSTRSCFIAYGFTTSALEKDVLGSVLKERGIEVVEAGSDIQPAKYAFCTKICSKIITSQFCIAILNNDVITTNGGDHERPNANVNIEYGLMLGHNKYIIPFQREDQSLPFNVAGLDTIKYTTKNFAELARRAIDLAITETTQNKTAASQLDQLVGAFLLSRDAIVVQITNDGERNLYNLGSPCGFNLLMRFDGLRFIFFGNFPAFRSEVTTWRLAKLKEIIDARFGSFEKRKALGLVTEKQVELGTHLINTLEIWILVTGAEQKRELENWTTKNPMGVPLKIFTIEDVRATADENIS